MSWLLPPLPPTFEAALRDVHGRKPESRIAAAERLADASHERRDEALAGLRALAADRDARVRAAAAHALGELGDLRALPDLVRLLDDQDALVRELAVVALGDVGEDEACAELHAALRSRHPEVRFQAVASYVKACAQPQLSALKPLLRDDDAKVRESALRSLARFGAEGRAELQRALGDGEAGVRAEAAIGLARLGEAPPPDALRPALDDPELLPDALDAIGALQMQALREEAARIALSVLKPLPHKVAAARALIRLGDARGVPALRSTLRALRSDARSYAVQVVGELKLRELTPELLRLSRRLRGTDPEALACALAALLALDPSARDGLVRLARRRDAGGEQARKALADARSPRG
jgi:HEAT repeat protein